MKLEKYALIAEIASGIAIVLTLVILIVEVREGSQQTALNTQALRVSNYQDLIAQINELNVLQIENRFAFASISRASSWGDFSDEDARVARSMMTLVFRHGDLAYYQHEQGMLTEDRMESALRPLTNGLCSPLFREFWDDFRMNVAGNYRSFIETRIDEDC
jgi:hypothetical protein